MLSLLKTSLAAAAAFLCIAGAGLAQAPGKPGGFGGPGEGLGGMPQPGQIFLPGFLQSQLKLTAEQSKKLDKLQKQVDADVKKILTKDQQTALTQVRRNPFGGPGGFPGPGFPPPGGGFPGPGGFGFPGGPGGPGFGDRGAATSLEDVKKQLGATDAEWQVIGPQVQTVEAARRALLGQAPAAGPMGGHALAQAQAGLRALLADPKHSKDDVQALVTAVRKARDNARTELAAAQRELRQLLTEEQQVVAVSLGYLD